MNLSIITGPSFIAGLLQGLNKRSAPEFKPDPWASYKVLSLTSSLAFLKILGSYEAPTKSSMRQLAASGLVGAPLITGTAYCMGLLLTKIPSKDIV